MANPIEMIGSARRRLTLISVVRVLAFYVPPAIIALVLAGAFGLIGEATWERLGYVMSPSCFGAIRLALLAVGVVIGLVGAYFFWTALRKVRFDEAAERVDQAVDGRQEVLTLATVADPDEPAFRNRGALFPILWRRVSALLDSFNPRRSFPINVARPLRDSGAFTFVIIVVLAIVTLAFVYPPTPDQVAAEKLIEMSKGFENSPTDKEIARKMIDAAEALKNSDAPPQEKLQKIAELQQELERRTSARKQQPPPAKSAKSANAKTRKGDGNSKSQANAASGKGNGGTGKGEGSSNSGGNGKGKGNGNGAGKNTASSADHSGKSKGDTQNAKENTQLAELQNELAKAQAQIETEGAKNPGPVTKPGEKKGKAPKPGNKPGSNQIAGNQLNGSARMNQPNQMGKGPQPGANKNGGNNTLGGNQGDTHLGEYPAPVHYQRFYKNGKGPPIHIHDARYVLFRLPPTTPSAAGGKLMLDKEGPRATTPYVNVPLKESHNDLSPDERQLVPPRYRDLIQ